MYKLLALCCVVLISGCAVKPEPVETNDHLLSVYNKLKESYQEQAKVPVKLTLSQAIARALKYNMDYRLQSSLIALESGQMTLAKLKMLPSFNTEVNYYARNNNYRQLLVTNDGDTIANESSVTPREITDGRLGLNWNLLDMGLSYVQAKQQADKVLIAQEQRRKIAQHLVHEVTQAYLKAYSAQLIRGEVKATLDEIDGALKRSREVIANSASPATPQLDFQRLLLSGVRRLAKMQLELDKAQSDLYHLIHLPAASKHELTLNMKAMDFLPAVNTDVKALDVIALAYRPELREMSYRVNIADKGVASTILSMLPGLHLGYGYAFTTNQFMQNRRWLAWDINLSWDMLQAATSGFKNVDLSKAQVDMEKLKELAMSATVLTQVRIAYMSYLIDRNDYLYAIEDAETAGKLLDNAQKEYEAKKISQQILVRRNLDALFATLDRYTAFAKAHDAYGRLYDSIGIQFLPQNLDLMSLPDVTKFVEKWLHNNRYYNFSKNVNMYYDYAQQYLNASPEELKKNPFNCHVELGNWHCLTDEKGAS